MSIRSMRTGDTIIGKDGRTYEVETKSLVEGKVKARSTNPPKRLKTFKAEDLECVDLDDGLWQEMEPVRW